MCQGNLVTGIFKPSRGNFSSPILKKKMMAPMVDTKSWKTCSNLVILKYIKLV